MALVHWIVIALLGLVAPAVPGTATDVVEREAWAMGTRLRIWIEPSDASRTRASRRRGEEKAAASGRSAEAVSASEAVLREVERLESVLSTWSQASEIAKVNVAAPGRPARVGTELLDLLIEAESWARRTGRAFDATVGPLIEVWDMRGRGRVPAPKELRAARRAVGAGAFAYDARGGRIERRIAGAWLDTGAFGKGAALRASARILRASGVERALVDLGGQLWVGGDAEWSIGVAHPSRRHEAVVRLEVREVSVATSGASERWVEVDGERLGHILDPRTGAPVGAWGSVTVVSPDPLEADVLATALYVMGPGPGLAWASAHTDAGVLFLEERDGRLHVTWSPAMERWLEQRPVVSQSSHQSSHQTSRGMS